MQRGLIWEVNELYIYNPHYSELNTTRIMVTDIHFTSTKVPENVINNPSHQFGR
jgi:hypothetical protein